MCPEVREAPRQAPYVFGQLWLPSACRHLNGSCPGPSQVSRAPRGSAQTPASFWEPCLPSHPLCLPNPAFQVIAPCHRPLPPSHTLWWWGTEDGLWARLTLLPGSGFFSREMSLISGQQHRPWGEGPLGICRGAVCGPADHPHAVDLEAQVQCAGLLVGLRLCI